MKTGLNLKLALGYLFAFFLSGTCVLAQSGEVYVSRAGVSGSLSISGEVFQESSDLYVPSTIKLDADKQESVDWESLFVKQVFFNNKVLPENILNSIEILLEEQSAFIALKQDLLMSGVEGLNTVSVYFGDALGEFVLDASFKVDRTAPGIEVQMSNPFTFSVKDEGSGVASVVALTLAGDGTFRDESAEALQKIELGGETFYTFLDDESSSPAESFIFAVDNAGNSSRHAVGDKSVYQIMEAARKQQMAVLKAQEGENSKDSNEGGILFGPQSAKPTCKIPVKIVAFRNTQGVFELTDPKTNRSRKVADNDDHVRNRIKQVVPGIKRGYKILQNALVNNSYLSGSFAEDSIRQSKLDFDLNLKETELKNRLRNVITVKSFAPSNARPIKFVTAKGVDPVVSNSKDNKEIFTSFDLTDAAAVDTLSRNYAKNLASGSEIVVFVVDQILEGKGKRSKSGLAFLDSGAMIIDSSLIPSPKYPIYIDLTFAHEMGHLMGLGHVNPDKFKKELQTNIMAPAFTTANTMFSAQQAMRFVASGCGLPTRNAARFRKIGQNPFFARVSANLHYAAVNGFICSNGLTGLKEEVEFLELKEPSRKCLQYHGDKYPNFTHYPDRYRKADDRAIQAYKDYKKGKVTHPEDECVCYDVRSSGGGSSSLKGEPVAVLPPNISVRPIITQYSTIGYGGSLCGNGALNAGEECDSSSKGCKLGESCTSSCKCKNLCGNGELENGEQCDGSKHQCAKDHECNSKCQCIPKCGNGKKDTGEECDTPTFQCRAGYDCKQCKCILQCGNGELDKGEECDGDKHKCPDKEVELRCINSTLTVSGRCVKCKCEYLEPACPEEPLAFLFEEGFATTMSVS